MRYDLEEPERIEARRPPERPQERPPDSTPALLGLASAIGNRAFSDLVSAQDRKSVGGVASEDELEDSRSALIQRSNGGGAAPAPAGPAAAAAPAAAVAATFGNVRASSTPVGMPDRIPPRVDTPVAFTVSGWSPPLAPVTLSIENAGGANGEGTIDGAPTIDVTTGATVNVRGTVQTAPGNGGNLRLAASIGGSVIARSPGFSVSSVPQNYTDTFDSLLTGARRGFVVQDGWESDSGVFGDLDETEISEEVEVTTANGCFAGMGGSVSGYLPGNVLTKDTHSTPTAALTSPGVRIAQQTCKFKDKRSGAADIPMKDSGFRLTRTVFRFLMIGPLRITTEKVGAATTANGVPSAAGVCSVSQTQWV